MDTAEFHLQLEHMEAVKEERSTGGLMRHMSPVGVVGTLRLSADIEGGRGRLDCIKNGHVV